MSFKFKNNKSEFSLLDAFIKLSKEKENFVAVGFPKKINSKYENGQTVIDVAILNEYGTERIPARPFMKKTAIKYSEELNLFRKKLAKKIIKGTLKLGDALILMGEWYSSKIKYVMDNEEFAPNAPSTIAKKGAGLKPLHGLEHLLIPAITYEVREKK